MSDIAARMRRAAVCAIEAGNDWPEMLAMDKAIRKEVRERFKPQDQDLEDIMVLCVTAWHWKRRPLIPVHTFDVPTAIR